MATIRKRNGRFQVQIRRKGRGASKTFQRLQEAKVWARETEIQMDKGELQPSLDPDLILKDLILRYRDTITIGKKSAETENYKLNKLLRHPIAKTPLAELTPSKFASYRDERLKDGPRACQYDLVLLKHMIRLARDEWGIPINACPIKMIEMPKQAKGRTRRLEKGELEKILIQAEASRNQHLKQVIQFAIETAMRRGEILALEWRDISFQQRTATVRMSKNGESRVIPLTTVASDVLKGVRGTEGKVFPTSANALRLAWGRALDRSGIENLHFHDLRHEAISRFFEMGLSVPEVALISGHRDPRMLFRYTHPRVQDVGKKLARTSILN